MSVMGLPEEIERVKQTSNPWGKKRKPSAAQVKSHHVPPHTHLVPDLMVDTNKGGKIQRQQDSGPLEELMAGDSIPGQNAWQTSTAPSVGSIRCFT